MKLGYECPSCQKAMFYIKERPLPGSTVYASEVYVDEVKPQPVNGEVIRCQFCKALLFGLNADKIKEYE